MGKGLMDSTFLTHALKFHPTYHPFLLAFTVLIRKIRLVSFSYLCGASSGIFSMHKNVKSDTGFTQCLFLPSQHDCTTWTIHDLTHQTRKRLAVKSHTIFQCHSWVFWAICYIPLTLAQNHFPELMHIPKQSRRLKDIHWSKFFYPKWILFISVYIFIRHGIFFLPCQ